MTKAVPKKKQAKEAVAKASSKKKTKFQNVINKDALYHKKPKKKSPCRFYTAVAENGIFLAYAKHPSQEIEPFLWPIKKKFVFKPDEHKGPEYKEKKAFAAKAAIEKMLPHRHPNGQNIVMPSDGKESNHAFSCFLHLHDAPEDATVEDILTDCDEWGKNGAAEFTKVGMSPKFTFPNEFQYMGNATQGTLLPNLETTFPPAAAYLLDHDVVSLVELMYSTTPLAEIAADDDMVISFFGEDRLEEGRRLLQHRASE